MSARSSTKRAYLLAAILVVGFGASAAAKAAHYGGDCYIPILDPHNGDDPCITNAIISVTEHFVISDIDVRLNITHTNIIDLQLYLEKVGGKRICLNAYTYGEFFDGDNYIETIFDDEAITPIEETQPPFTGRFKPLSTYKLSEFYGEDAFGDWRLQIYDLYPADTGTLDSFELFINVPEPATAMLLALAAVALPSLNVRKR